MTDLKDITPPADLDWSSWVERWDRMQERYLVKRAERFAVVTRLIGATRQAPAGVLDLGYGPVGILAAKLIGPSRVFMIDNDPRAIFGSVNTREVDGYNVFIAAKKSFTWASAAEKDRGTARGLRKGGR